ncbi:hypothetical protein [Streptomyces olivochromogenes]|uniref:Uncharacterized protein n=1 Tax=Streptomyces olivochromogenes TaxID=1963 RepID=A0A250VFM4_STROL|nr:hypothetical protein [Streptomyces olivochromogenes]KUN47448.1 hypothetical protein AQJ27_10960 [Streptomyces olivochromogenes]GAX52866.1 hypothetical protein SO3561_04385 [Streptomyces olivochromogenes]
MEVADTLQPGDGWDEFTARLRPAYERVVGYVPSPEAMPRLMHRLVREGVLVVADDGDWNVSPRARKAASALPSAARGSKAAVPGQPTVSEAARRALVEADLLAHPDDTVAARARRLGAQMGLKDRAARGRISAIVSALRTAT